MLRLYELLARKGIEVVLVASDPPEDAAWAKVGIYKYAVRDPLHFYRTFWILRQERPDLLHSLAWTMDLPVHSYSDLAPPHGKAGCYFCSWNA